MTIARHFPTAHGAYHDLLRALLDDRISDIRGTPKRGERNGRIDWHNNTRLHGAIGCITPNETEDAFYASLNADEKSSVII